MAGEVAADLAAAVAELVLLKQERRLHGTSGDDDEARLDPNRLHPALAIGGHRLTAVTRRLLTSKVSARVPLRIVAPSSLAQGR